MKHMQSYSFESSLVPSEALGFSELFVTFRRFLVAFEFDFFFGKIGWLLVYKKIEQHKSIERSKPHKPKMDIIFPKHKVSQFYFTFFTSLNEESFSFMSGLLAVCFKFD